MTSISARTFLVLVVAAAFVRGVEASGYSIYEQGAEAMANGGAFTARADGPSALFFNPAGLMQLDGIQLEAGLTSIFRRGSEFRSAASGETFAQVDGTSLPFTGYLTQRLGDRFVWGVGVLVPYGLATEWDDAFEGRFISRKAELLVVTVNPNLAFRLARGWSAAVGVSYAYTDVKELSRNIDLTPLGFPGSEGFVDISGDGHDFGWNVAARWAGDSGWRWGLSYRASMEPTIEGDVTFSDIPAPLAALFPDGPGRSSLPLPATLATGVGRVADKWEAEFDIVWTDWSMFDRLGIDFARNTAVPNPSPPPDLIPVVADVSQIEAWDDTLSFRAGFSYHVTPKHEWRAGAYFDQNPMDESHIRPRLPDADRTSVQAGYGYTGRRFRLDVAYQALFFADRTARGTEADPENPVIAGHYENFVHLVGVSARWALGEHH